MENNIAWQLADTDHPARLWLVTEAENLLISWESLQEIRASDDFLTLQFICEYGQISFSSRNSLRELFEYLQLEKIRRIDGRKLSCRIISPNY